MQTLPLLMAVSLTVIVHAWGLRYSQVDQLGNKTFLVKHPLKMFWILVEFIVLNCHGILDLLLKGVAMGVFHTRCTFQHPSITAYNATH